MHSGGDIASAVLTPVSNSGQRGKNKNAVVGSDRCELEVLSEFEDEMDFVGAINGTASTGDRRYALERYKFPTQGSKLKQARSLKIYKDCIFVASPAFDELDKASRQQYMINMRDLDLQKAHKFLKRLLALRVQDEQDDIVAIMEVMIPWPFSDTIFNAASVTLSSVSSMTPLKKAELSLEVLISGVLCEFISENQDGRDNVIQFGSELKIYTEAQHCIKPLVEYKEVCEDFVILQTLLDLLTNPDPKAVTDCQANLGKIKEMLVGGYRKGFECIAVAFKASEYWAPFVDDLKHGLLNDKNLWTRIRKALDDADHDVTKLVTGVLEKLGTWSKDGRKGGTSSYEAEVAARFQKKLDTVCEELSNNVNTAYSMTPSSSKELADAITKLGVHCRQTRNDHNMGLCDDLVTLKVRADKVHADLCTITREDAMEIACNAFQEDPMNLDSVVIRAQLDENKGQRYNNGTAAHAIRHCILAVSAKIATASQYAATAFDTSLAGDFTKMVDIAIDLAELLGESVAKEF